MRTFSRLLVVALCLPLGTLADKAWAQIAAAGEKVFAVCNAGEGAQNTVGPQLNDQFGRKSGTIEGYSYTAANKNSGITWDEAAFREYIKDPRAKIPGTKMIYAGLKDEQKVTSLSPAVRVRRQEEVTTLCWGSAQA